MCKYRLMPCRTRTHYLPVFGQTRRILGEALRVHHAAEHTIVMAGRRVLDRDQHRSGQTLYSHRWLLERGGRLCRWSCNPKPNNHRNCLIRSNNLHKYMLVLIGSTDTVRCVGQMQWIWWGNTQITNKHKIPSQCQQMCDARKYCVDVEASAYPLSMVSLQHQLHATRYDHTHTSTIIQYISMNMQIMCLPRFFVPT